MRSWAWNPIVNHAFGPQPFNAYSMSSAKTLCGERYTSLGDDETMTNTCMVSCLRCVSARLSK